VSRTETTATIASLLHLADKAGAPEAFTAQLWRIRGCDPDEQLQRLLDVREELAGACAPAEAVAAPLADVVPLFGGAR
jgi:hypothetical protein